MFRSALFTLLMLTVVLGMHAQRTNRGDICRQIPGLTAEQKQKIEKLSTAHQEKMDQLRNQFYSETDVTKATAIRNKMNTEMKDHYRNITGLLTAEQKDWYDQTCYATSGNRSYTGQGLGRNAPTYGRGLGRGYGRGRGCGLGPGRGYGRGRGYGVGSGRGCGRGPGFFAR